MYYGNVYGYDGCCTPSYNPCYQGCGHECDYGYPVGGFGHECGYGYPVGGCGYNNSFVLIVVLFILLIIIGASLYGNI